VDRRVSDAAGCGVVQVARQAQGFRHEFRAQGRPWRCGAGGRRRRHHRDHRGRGSDLLERGGDAALWLAAEEALGQSIMALTPALQAREDAERIMQDLQSGQRWEGEIVLRRRDGTPFRAFVFDAPLKGGDYIVGVSAPTAKRAAVNAAKPLIAALIDRLEGARRKGG
jgi:hypothetical protein